MGYRCEQCGVWHDERPMSFRAELPAIVATLGGSELSSRVERGSDQCILDREHFFILGNLDILVRGADDRLRWTVWTELTAKDFERASELWSKPGRETEPPYIGRLSNDIPGYPSSMDIRALVHTQPVGMRPTIEVIDERHPLAIDQHNGITEARADELIHAALHEDRH